MRCILPILFIISTSLHSLGQNILRPLDELINKEEAAWPLIQEWAKESTNKVEFLRKNTIKADSTLYYSQVTTRSPMGAIIYETGGILIDNGWLRILGSGNDKLTRSLIEWNKNKSFINLGEPLSFVLIADDVTGGFFAINGGGISKEGLGKIFYFNPRTLQWDNLEVGYTDFILFAFTGNLNDFYSDLRWTDWEKDILKTNNDKAYAFYPFLYTEEGRDINKVNKKLISIEELWKLNFKPN